MSYGTRGIAAGARASSTIRAGTLPTAVDDRRAGDGVRMQGGSGNGAQPECGSGPRLLGGTIEAGPTQTTGISGARAELPLKGQGGTGDRSPARRRSVPGQGGLQGSCSTAQPDIEVAGEAADGREGGASKCANCAPTSS